VFQYLMGVSGVPGMLADVLGPLKSHHWLFLLATALITMMFGMVLEGLPAAVVLIPVVFPIAEKMGIDPIHFNIVQTAAVGIGLFLPPMGVGLLMALRFANLTVGQALALLHAVCRGAAGRADADHPAARPVAVPAEERPASSSDVQATLVTVNRWCLPSRAVQEIDWPLPRTDQGRADRRHHRDAVLVEALVGRIDQLEGAGVAVIRLEGHGRAHAHHVARHLRRIDDLRALELVEQLLRHVGQALHRGVGEIGQPLVIGGADDDLGNRTGCGPWLQPTPPVPGAPNRPADGRRPSAGSALIFSLFRPGDHVADDVVGLDRGALSRGRAASRR
jgi:hypothetical protein